MIGVGNDNLWNTFCKAFPEMPELISDSRFGNNRLRTENIDALNFILEPFFASKPASYWLELMEKSGIPCSSINDIESVMQDPQLLARNMFVEVKEPVAGTVKIAGNPIKMSSFQDSSQREPAPEIGEHNKEIYCKRLGLSEDYLTALQKAGVI